MEHFRQTIKNCVSSPGKYFDIITSAPTAKIGGSCTLFLGGAPEKLVITLARTVT